MVSSPQQVKPPAKPNQSSDGAPAQLPKVNRETLDLSCLGPFKGEARRTAVPATVYKARTRLIASLAKGKDEDSNVSVTQDEQLDAFSTALLAANKPQAAKLVSQISDSIKTQNSLRLGLLLGERSEEKLKEYRGAIESFHNAAKTLALEHGYLVDISHAGEWPVVSAVKEFVEVQTDKQSYQVCLMDIPDSPYSGICTQIGLPIVNLGRINQKDHPEGPRDFDSTVANELAHAYLIRELNLGAGSEIEPISVIPDSKSFPFLDKQACLELSNIPLESVRQVHELVSDSWSSRLRPVENGTRLALWGIKLAVESSNGGAKAVAGYQATAGSALSVLQSYSRAHGGEPDVDSLIKELGADYQAFSKKQQALSDKHGELLYKSFDDPKLEAEVAKIDIQLQKSFNDWESTSAKRISTFLARVPNEAFEQIATVNRFQGDVIVQELRSRNSK